MREYACLRFTIATAARLKVNDERELQMPFQGCRPAAPPRCQPYNPKDLFDNCARKLSPRLITPLEEDN